MPYDGLVTKNMCIELSNTLLNGKIDKIIQPTKDEILLFIRNNRITYKLLLSSNAQNARTHITTIKTIENPTKPFNFCMVLRKYLMSAKLISISQPNNDRIINFTFENSNELGDKEIKKLIIEMMGKHSNIILTTEKNTIIDSIHHIDFDISSIREVMPGRTYFLPPTQDKLNPFKISEKDYDDLIKSRCILSSRLIGICKIVANELKNLSYYDFKTYLSQQQKPIVSLKNNVPNDFYFTFLPSTFTETKEFETLSEAIDYFYTYKLLAQKLENIKNDLGNIVMHFIHKTEKKLQIIEDKLETTKNIEELKLLGELLSANLYRVIPFSSEITVDNYYTNSSITIPLNPNLTPPENLQYIFKKYNKLKNTFLACSSQKESLSAELNYLESLFFEIHNQENIEDLEEIKLELISQNIIKKQGKKVKEVVSEPLEFIIDGYKVLVGKNNIQNDKLTFKIASKSDIWFHVKNAPGSHTILKTANNSVPRETLLKAASLAAFNSKLKNSPKVEVDFTEVKNVKKIHGAKPGMVIYENYKTLYVEPNVF